MYISIILLLVLSTRSYVIYLKEYFSIFLNQVTYLEMVDPATPSGRLVANGTLTNTLMMLTDQVERMKIAAGVFQIVVFVRVIQLLCHFTKRLDTIGKTVFRAT